MSVSSSVGGSVSKSIASATTGRGGGVGGPADPPAGSLSVSNTSPTEGDLVTWSWVGTGATAYQLYKDGVYVWGGDTLPYSRRVGTVDTGSYTIVATGPGGSVTTSAVVVTVAASYLVTDDFTGSVSANWTSSTGSPSLTSNRYNVNLTALGAGTQFLSRTISDNNTRIRFVYNADGLTSGNTYLFRIMGGTYEICNGLLIANGADPLLRISPNVSGWYWGADYRINQASGGYATAGGAGTHTVEIRWDYNTRNAYIYFDDVLFVSIINCGGNGAGLDPAPAVSVQFGKYETESATGSYYIDSAQVKQGQYIAAQPITANSRQAIVHIWGQSNAIGAADGSYSAVTDAIGDYALMIGGNGDEAGYWPLTRNAAPNSTSVAYGFIQNVDLPATFNPIMQNGGVGSTSFSGTDQWNTGGTIRLRCIEASQTLVACSEEVANIAILFQGFEGDTGAYTESEWDTLVATFMSELRTAINDANCPLIIGGFSPAYLTGGEAPSANYITRNAQNQDYAENDDARGAFASTTSPTSVSYQANPAQIHFDAAGYRALGARHAAAYLTLQPAATP